jgi:hypothetical protein
MDVKQLQQENVLLGMIMERNMTILALHQENLKLKQPPPAPPAKKKKEVSDG